MVILEFLFVLGIFVPHSVLLVTCFGLVVIQFRTSFSVHHQLARFSSWVCGLLVGVEHDIHGFMGTGPFFMSYSCCLRWWWWWWWWWWLLILTGKGVKSDFHWLRTTTSCLEKPRSVLHFYVCSLVYISNTFLRILADPKRAHHWISSMDVPTPMVLRFSFILSGIVPNASTTMGVAFFLMTPFFRISLARSLYFSTFSSCFALTLLSSGIATSIIWQLFSLLSMINRSSLLASISLSVLILESHSIL